MAVKEVNTPWRCEMCSISLNEAVRQNHNPLTMDVDDYLNDKLDKNIEQYIYERIGITKKKKTCSKSCGWNYSSWLRTQEPKKSYIKEGFNCDCCGNFANGGRLLMNHTRNFRICRKCHRKKITTDSRRLWEIFHKDYRAAYHHVWMKANPKKMKLYKKRYLKRVKKNEPRLKNKRKITCAVNPALML